MPRTHPWEISDEFWTLVEPLIPTSLRSDDKIYKIYLSLDATEITLGWDKQNSSFFVKGKAGKPKHMTFKCLSVNNHTFIENDHSGCQGDESKMRGIGFFIPGNELAEAVEPGV